MASPDREAEIYKQKAIALLSSQWQGQPDPVAQESGARLGAQLADQGYLTPEDVLSKFWGNRYPEALSSAQAYRKANPDELYLNNVGREAMQRQIPVDLERFGEGMRGATNFWPSRVAIADRQQDAYSPLSTLAHEMRHASGQGYSQYPLTGAANDSNYYDRRGEWGARIPFLTRDYLLANPTKSFPRTPEEADAVLKFGGFTEQKELDQAMERFTPSLPAYPSKATEEQVHPLLRNFKNKAPKEQRKVLDVLRVLLPGMVQNSSQSTADRAV